MIRLITCLVRKPGISPQEFRRHFNDERFILLVEKVAIATRAVRSQRALTLDVEVGARIAALRPEAAHYDGVVEYWWRAGGTFEDTVDNQEALDARSEIWAYQAKFVDLSRSSSFFTDA